MKDHISYTEFVETCADWYDWIEIWFRVKEMIEEVEEQLEEDSEMSEDK